jgi:protein-S-isoprenylcysteine O-methyltransferase Ste14
VTSKLYLVGAALVVAGLVYVAYLLHVPPKWIAAITIILVGLAILKTAKTTRGGPGAISS